MLDDYFRASEASRKRILLSGMAGEASLTPALRARLGPTAEAVEICPVPGLADTTAWLSQRLGQLCPRRIFLFHHPEDAPAVAAVAAFGAEKCHLVHHADSTPCVGLHVPGLRLIDLAPFPAWVSRQVLGLATLYLPLAGADPGPPPVRRPNDRLRTCTHGSAVKFADHGPCAFASTVARVLAATGGDHLHIGPLDDDRRNSLRRALEAAGVSPDRFTHIKHVTSLVPALREFGLDVSLGSFPVGGARGHIDMMSMGIPHLTYLDNPSHAPWKLHLLAPGACHWSTQDGLVKLLAEASPEWLAAQSALMRRHFLLHHDARQFRSRLAALDDVAALPSVPPMPASTRASWAAALAR